MVLPVDSKVPEGTKVTLEECLEKFFGEELITDLICPNCQAKTSFSKTTRLNTFPRVLILVLQREVFDEWVPKKLEVDF